MRTAFSILLPVLVLAGYGCIREKLRRSPDGVFRDPVVMAVDVDAPFTDFEGWHGSILLTEGWGKREGDGHHRDWGSFSWSVAKEAAFYAVLPDAPELDLHARCIPFPNGPFLRRHQLRDTLLEPRQTLTLVWNSRIIGSVRLVRDTWQTIRIPLPDNLPRGTLEKFEFRFSRVTKPSEISGAGNKPLGAAFTEIAIVPRETADPDRLIETLKNRYDRGSLRLIPGFGWEFPTAAARRIRVRFLVHQAQCSGCKLRIEYIGSGNEPKTIWSRPIPMSEGSDSPREPVSVQFDFAADERAIGRLRFTVVAVGRSSLEAASYVEILIPEDFIQYAEANGPSGELPNIFIYLIDTLRADALAPYGGSPDVSPHIQAFAADAVTYKFARAPTSWTLPSVVSLVTGVYASRHGIMKGDIKYAESVSRSIMSRLSQAGYQTLGVSQSFVFGPAFGLESSFSSFYLNDQLNSFALRSERIRRFLLQWLYHRAAAGKPVFAYFHTVDPHAPYAPVGEFQRFAAAAPGRLRREDYLPLNFMVRGHGGDKQEIAHLKALYLGEVMYADREFGRFIDLLKHLGLYDGSLIVLVSDHGEEFGEHGGFDHGRTLYEEQLRVPLIIKYPHSRWAGTVVTEPVSTIDVAPTLLEYVGVGADSLAAEGRVLPPLGEESRRRRGRILAAELDVPPAEHRAAVNYRALIRETTKCIQSLNGQDQFGKPAPDWQLFDLSRDPDEARADVSGGRVELQCEELLAAWQAGRRRQEPTQRRGDKASEKSLERLRSLGYIK